MRTAKQATSGKPETGNSGAALGDPSSLAPRFSLLAPHRAWIEAALPYCYGTHTMEDVERQIAEGRLQFWPGERCAVITEIVDYPRLRALNFFLVGGDLNELIEKIEPAIVAWAKALGCTRVAQTGRKGWGRVLAPLGYRTTLSVMIRDLA